MAFDLPVCFPSFPSVVQSMPFQASRTRKFHFDHTLLIFQLEKRHPKAIAYSLPSFSAGWYRYIRQYDVIQPLLQKAMGQNCGCPLTHGGAAANKRRYAGFGRVPGVHHPTGLFVMFVPSQQISENYSGSIHNNYAKSFDKETTQGWVGAFFEAKSPRLL